MLSRVTEATNVIRRLLASRVMQADLKENGVEGVINSCLIGSRRRAQGKAVATDRQAGG